MKSIEEQVFIQDFNNVRLSMEKMALRHGDKKCISIDGKEYTWSKLFKNLMIYHGGCGYIWFSDEKEEL